MKVTGNVVWQSPLVRREMREALNGHKSLAVLLTGLPGSGKSTIAHRVEMELHMMGIRTYILDGDNVRHGLCSDLGFTPEDRAENLRRVAETTKLLVDAGLVVILAFVSPFEKDRQMLKQILGPTDFLLVYLRCPIEICEKRDPKGMYAKARRGEIRSHHRYSPSQHQ